MFNSNAMRSISLPVLPRRRELENRAIALSIVRTSIFSACYNLNCA
jgi:hypothetical protein